MRWTPSPGRGAPPGPARAARPRRRRPAGVEEGARLPRRRCPADEMSEAQRAEIRALIAGNVARLAAENRLPAASAAGVLLAWPLVPHLGPEDFELLRHLRLRRRGPEFPDPGARLQLRQPHLRQRLRVQPPRHRHLPLTRSPGTGWTPTPSRWSRAPTASSSTSRTATSTATAPPSGNWNAVFVRHADGSQCLVRPHEERLAHRQERRRRGGHRRAPRHRRQLGQLDRTAPPFRGARQRRTGWSTPGRAPATSMNPDSWWAAQRPYYDSAINKLMTGFAAMVRGTCPKPDSDQRGGGVPARRHHLVHPLLSRPARAPSPACAPSTVPTRACFAPGPRPARQPYYAAAYVVELVHASAPASRSGSGASRWCSTARPTTTTSGWWAPGPWLLRNARLTSIAPLSAPLASIFVGSRRPDARPRRPRRGAPAGRGRRRRRLRRRRSPPARRTPTPRCRRRHPAARVLPARRRRDAAAAGQERAGGITISTDRLRPTALRRGRDPLPVGAEAGPATPRGCRRCAAPGSVPAVVLPERRGALAPGVRRGVRPVARPHPPPSAASSRSRSLAGPTGSWVAA